MTRFCVWVYARQSVYPHGEPSKFISVFGTCTFISVQWKRKMKKLLFSSFPAFSRPPLTGKYSLTARHKNMWNKTDRNFLRRALSLCIVLFFFKKKTFITALLLLNCSKIWIYDYFLLWCNLSVHFVDLSLSLIRHFIWFLLSSSSSKHRCTETLFTGVRDLLFLGRGRLDFSGA